jgi:hypothetical protein
MLLIVKQRTRWSVASALAQYLAHKHADSISCSIPMVSALSDLKTGGWL